MTHSVSILIPALNEAGNIANTAHLVLDSLAKYRFSDFEIILVDGGSRDNTSQIMDELATHNANIRVIRSSYNRGLGYSFRCGVSRATKDYVGWFPGDNETLSETMDNIFQQLGKADIIVPYTVNPWVRPYRRRILSSLYTWFFNTLFGLHLRYFNGTCFFKRNLLNMITMTSDGPAYMAEILVQLIKKEKMDYVEVPMHIRGPREYGKTSMLKWKNVGETAKTAAYLFWRIYVTKRKRR